MVEPEDHVKVSTHVRSGRGFCGFESMRTCPFGSAGKVESDMALERQYRVVELRRGR